MVRSHHSILLKKFEYCVMGMSLQSILKVSNEFLMGANHLLMEMAWSLMGMTHYTLYYWSLIIVR